MAAVALTAAALSTSGCAANPFKRGPAAMSSSRGGDTQIGVNAFLWRASLDTLAFMPLASADPYGGIIITDWYANPEAPNERFKATVYILDTRLRADGLNVTIHRQVKAANGDWQDAVTQANTAETIENQILVRARQIRISGR
ncbi:MAG: DUF3576 domain-containing protein [Alphaproteobacteria bacterium]